MSEVYEDWREGEKGGGGMVASDRERFKDKDGSGQDLAKLLRSRDADATGQNKCGYRLRSNLPAVPSADGLLSVLSHRSHLPFTFKLQALPFTLGGHYQSHMCICIFIRRHYLRPILRIL